ncbi:7TM diverse intracellular signaling domain-containing protein [Desulfobacula sp.]|jgi:signal transduction histidine kinase|uniref:sensor histidine kinase n=1 Tax=Desulfobacula sp. TaxID=2593537 RepID=UPI001DB2226F|nr:hypothetical protein [Desulfobacula sp.]MBT6341260.1 hypothetical protein [Desulfobacula sp.]MBT7261236.1 hypothetical protein [Desulfobacula sp.]
MEEKTASYKKARYYCQLLCFFITLIFPSLSEAAVKELLVSYSADQYQLGYNIQTLEDKTGELSIADVSSSLFDKQFIDNHTAGINKGLTDSFLWVRFSLAADYNNKEPMIAGDTANRTEWLIYLGKHLDYYDQINVYWQEGTKWQTKTYGQLQALKRKTRDPLCIRVILPENGLQPVTYYIRMNIKSGFFLKPTLYSIAGYDRFSKKMSLFYGGYYGLALGLIVYNLFLLLFLGDRVRVLFILYVLSLSSYFVVTNELGYPFLSTEFLPATKKAAQFLCLLFIIQFTHFAVVFLDAKNTIPRFYRLLQFAMLSIFCMLLSMPFVSFTSLGKIVGFYAPVIFIQILFAGIAAWHSGYRPARLFVFAWLFLLGGAIVNSLTFVGIFPYAFIGDHAVQAGSGIEMIFLSLAMADRVWFTMEELNREKIIREKQLTGLTHQLIQTEERERRRIAVNLHDHIGHALSNIMLKLGTFKQSFPASNSADMIDDISTIVEQCIEDTHSLTFDISPPILYDLGMEEALDWLAEQTQTKHNIMIRFEDDEQDKPLDESVRVLLFQAARELLFNMVKHSQATLATVSIERIDQNIKIVIEDNGIGFDPSAERYRANKKGGFGLFSIKERLAQLGGRFKIDSTPGKGARITIISPMKKSEEFEYISIN